MTTLSTPHEPRLKREFYLAFWKAHILHHAVEEPAVIVAIVFTAVVATFNALSSAQLAAAHSVSGGTYEYGYEFLRPSLGHLGAGLHRRFRDGHWFGRLGIPLPSDRGRSPPLELAAHEFGTPLLPGVVAIGAATAMLGVLLNLILGLSRVLPAMGRRGDMPGVTARLDISGTTPVVAVLMVGILIAGLTLIGSIWTTWSFSTFAVLIYYAITNAPALALPAHLRLFPRWIPVAGLIACLFLAFWVEWQICLTGLLLILVGLEWHFLMKRIANNKGVRRS